MTAAVRQTRPRQTEPVEGKRVGGYRPKSLSAAMIDFDLRAAAPEAPQRRCCGKCKTPYNCGNKACPCHSF